MEFSWQNTRNIHEAAVLASLKIGVQPVRMLIKNQSDAHDVTEWNLRPVSEDGVYHTSPLRQAFNNGTLRGLFLTETLHPFLVAARAMHNRHQFLDAQKGRAMRSVEAAPGSWILEPGHYTPAELAGAYLETVDQDRALALIGNGSALISITGPEGSRIYRFTRLALPSTLLAGPRADNGIWWTRHRDQTVFPEHAGSHFGQQIHALHCLRELRRRQHSTRFLIIQQKTPFHKGGALKENAPSDVQARMQRTLGVRL